MEPAALGLSELFASAGCDGFVHACDVDGDAEVGLEPDADVVAASTFKVAVALELFRQAAAGELDPRERVLVDASASVPGPTGIALYADGVEISLRDLATSMLTLSDNAATDTLLRRLGLERVNELTRSLGLERTRIAGDVRFMCDRLAADAGFACWEDFAAHPWTDEAETAAALERLRASREADPAHATRTTPREATRLLSLIWRDEAAPPEACAEVRARMAQQLTRHRIARGLPPDATFAGKTGSFAGAIRNEVGVAVLPGGRRLAIAVFCRAHRLYERGREIDDAIGEAARLAVAALST